MAKQCVTELTKADLIELANSLIRERTRCNTYGGASLKIDIEIDKVTKKLSKIKMTYNEWPYES